MGQIVSQMHCVMYMLLSNLAGAIFVILASSSLPNIDHQYKHLLITKLRQNIFLMFALFLLNNNLFKKLFLFLEPSPFSQLSICTCSGRSMHYVIPTTIMSNSSMIILGFVWWTFCESSIRHWREVFFVEIYLCWLFKL